MSHRRAVRILGLPKPTHAEFRRAVALEGCSQSAWLAAQVRRFIRAQRKQYGDLFSVLTPEEREVVEAIQDGAAEFDDIAAETMITPRRVGIIITGLMDRGIVEQRLKGGKTDRARGARITLYFVSEQYQSKSE